jgi:hypothetical protein
MDIAVVLVACNDRENDIIDLALLDTGSPSSAFDPSF